MVHPYKMVAVYDLLEAVTIDTSLSLMNIRSNPVYMRMVSIFQGTE